LQNQKKTNVLTESATFVAKSTTPDTGRATTPTTPLPAPLMNPENPPFLAPSTGFVTTPQIGKSI
jgi:hypothetical protein